jgi:hypothetical protein
MNMQQQATFREMLTDALRYWEWRRIAYNAVLAAVVIAHLAPEWRAFFQSFRWIELLELFVLAVLANVCYSTAYLVDLIVQYSGLRSAWLRWRWVLWVIGTSFAAAWAWICISGGVNQGA